MKTIVVFTANNEELSLIPGLKEKVIQYMGDRSIEEKYDNTPHILLRGTLDNEDRKAISALIEKLNSQSVAMLLIETKKATINLSQFIIDLKPLNDE